MGPATRIGGVASVVGVPSLADVVARPDLIKHLSLDVCENWRSRGRLINGPDEDEE